MCAYPYKNGIINLIDFIIPFYLLNNPNKCSYSKIPELLIFLINLSSVSAC